MDTMDYIKANRKGSRDAELEAESGFTAKHHVHTSKHTYTRKEKHKNMRFDLAF